MENVLLGVIGGSGIYEIEGMEEIEEVEVKTPFGEPSDNIIVGVLEGTRVAFLPRHGRGHRIMPTEVNHRANIFAMKSLGVERILSISACGSLRENLKPRDFVFPTQLFDRTKARPSTFFGGGVVVHVGFADPYCGDFQSLLYKESNALGITSHLGGTYVCIEGPQFSTRAESEVYRHLGFDVIGMTHIPEAKLAREAEICYGSAALITDYDVWHESDDVDIKLVIENLMKNVENVKKLIKSVVKKIPLGRTCKCASALSCAIMTQKDLIPQHQKKNLNILIGKYIK